MFFILTITQFLSIQSPAYLRTPNFSNFHKFPLPTNAPAPTIIMLLTTILVPLSAIFAVVSAMPASTDTAALEARAALPSAPAPGGAADEGEITDISAWTAANAGAVSARDLSGVTCGTGKAGSAGQFIAWFTAAKDREICMASGEVRTWVDGKNRFKAANRTPAVRCNKFGSFAVNARQMQDCGLARVCGGSCWGKDHVFPDQTFSLYSV